MNNAGLGFFNGDDMHETINGNELQQLRNDAKGWIADEIERLQACERRLFVLAEWIEQTHPDDFKAGLWDKIEAA